mgnify:CR=1 FL=1
MATKRYSCFTAEQQAYYDKLNVQNQRYVDLRGKGYSRKSAYVASGYATSYPAQAAAKLEKANKGLVELIEVLQKNASANLEDENSAINQTINALSTQNNNDRVLQAVSEGDGETARRIQFYTNIMNGITKTVKIKKKYDKDGNLIEKVVEQVSDIAVRVQARKELDKLLGLNEILDIGSLQCGDININIVDARKKDEDGDVRNKIELDPNNVEIIDDEECVVVDGKDGEPNG